MRAISISGLTIVTASAALLAIMAAANAQPRRSLHRPDPITQSASCKVPHIEVLTSDEEIDGQPTDWTALPNGTIDFHSRRSGCVIVTFSAVVYSEFEQALVQMVLDGTAACGPANGMEYASTLFGPDTLFKTASMTYLCKNVPPGDHSLQVQYTTLGGALVQFYSHALTVAHN